MSTYKNQDHLSFCLSCNIRIDMEPNISLFSIRLCPACYVQQEKEAIKEGTLDKFLKYHVIGKPVDD